MKSLSQGENSLLQLHQKQEEELTDLLVEGIRHHQPSLCLLCTQPSSLTVMDSSSPAVASVYKYKAVSFENLFPF